MTAGNLFKLNIKERLLSIELRRDRVSTREGELAAFSSTNYGGAYDFNFNRYNNAANFDFIVFENFFSLDIRCESILITKFFPHSLTCSLGLIIIVPAALSCSASPRLDFFQFLHKFCFFLQWKEHNTKNNLYAKRDPTFSIESVLLSFHFLGKIFFTYIFRYAKKLSNWKNIFSS